MSKAASAIASINIGPIRGLRITVTTINATGITCNASKIAKSAVKVKGSLKKRRPPGRLFVFATPHGIKALSF